MSELDAEKLLYERFWCLLNDRQLMEVFEKYGPRAFRRSAVLEGFETFVKLHNFRGRTCVEIGTLKGLTALVLARYFENVVTIDIVDDADKRDIARMLGVNNIRFVTVRDNTEKERMLNAVEFDAAFVDGDHARDTASDFQLVRRCGRVLLHEHWAAQPAVVALVAGLEGSVITHNKWALWTN